MKAHISTADQKRYEHITCDKCEHEFKVNVQEELLGEVGEYGDVYRKYMECPECHAEYSVGFVNKQVQDLLDINEELAKQYNKTNRRKIQSNKKKGLRLMARIESQWNKQVKEALRNGN